MTCVLHETAQQKILPALQLGTKQHRHILGAYSWSTDTIFWKVTDWKNSQSFLEFIAAADLF